MKCCICGKEIEKKYTPDGKMYWDEGNNAEPIVKNGRCCDICDCTVVIPRRMVDMRKRMTEAKGDA